MGPEEDEMGVFGLIDPNEVHDFVWEGDDE